MIHTYHEKIKSLLSAVLEVGSRYESGVSPLIPALRLRSLPQKVIL